MCIHIAVNRERAKKVLELFNPATNNWMVWLATASFSAFVYASLSSVAGGGNMGELELIDCVVLIMAFVFLGIAGIAILVLGYLVVTWLKSIIKIRRRKGESLEPTTKNE